MASIVNDKNGRKRIQFTDSGGTRHSIRLGKATIKQAEVVKTKVETLVGDMIAGRPHDDEVSRWMRDLGATLRGKLEKVGLVQGVGRSNTTLGKFLEEYFNGLTVKASTKTIYGHTRRNLTDYFGGIVCSAVLRRSTGTDGDNTCMMKAWPRARSAAALSPPARSSSGR